MNASHLASMKRLPCLVAGALLLVATSGCNDPLAPECGPAGFASCWEFLGLEGVRVAALVDTERGLYAGTLDAGVLRYDRASGSWEPLGLNHAHVWDLLYMKSMDRLLAGMLPPEVDRPSYAAIFASDDGGATWFPSDGGRGEARDGYAAATTLLEDQRHPGRVYAGESSNVFRSADYGSEWKLVYGLSSPGGGGYWTSAISRVGVVYVGGSDAVGNTSIIWSADGGETWAGKSPYGAFVTNTVLSIFPHPIKRNVLYATVVGEILRSDDAGRSWRIVYSHRIHNWRPEFWALVLVDDVLYAAANQRESPPGEPPEHGLGLYASRLGKENWEFLPTPSTADGALSMIRARDGSLIIGTRSGVWRVRT